YVGLIPKTILVGESERKWSATFRSVSKPSSIGTGCKLDGTWVLPRPVRQSPHLELLPRLAPLQRHRSTRLRSNRCDGIRHTGHGESQVHSHQQRELSGSSVPVRAALGAWVGRR